MTWQEPKDHCNNCYFCAVKNKGINRENRNFLIYPNLDPASRTVSHNEELLFPVFEGFTRLDSSHSSEEEDVSNGSDNTIADISIFSYLFYPRNSSPGELSDLEKDLNLSLVF